MSNSENQYGWVQLKSLILLGICCLLSTSRLRAQSAELPSPLIAPFNAVQARAGQEAWAKGMGVQPTVDNSIGMKLLLIPPGEFLRGSSDEDIEMALQADPHLRDFESKQVKDEQPQHRVRITRPFYLSKFETTQDQFQKLMGRNPTWFAATGMGKKHVDGIDTAQFPIEQVTWFDCVEFCNRLSAAEGKTPCYELSQLKRLPDQTIRSAEVRVLSGNGYRLPTEAEWEFACRAGTTTLYHFGHLLQDEPATVGGNSPFGMFSTGSYIVRPSPVSAFAANAFGLHGMSGNVWEWCQDGYHESAYRDYLNKLAIDPVFHTDTLKRVIRGGSENYFRKSTRSTNRAGAFSSYQLGTLGFRVVCNLHGPKGTADVPLKTQRLARPISLAFLQHDRRLLVANRDSASITTIDPKSRKVLGEWFVPGATQLTEMIVSSDQQSLIVCSQKQNRIWLLRREADNQFSVLESFATAEGPVGLTWRGETEVMVTCQWSRMVQFVTVDPTAISGMRLTLRDRLELPFAPRRSLAIGPSNQALVADSFGGSIGLIETTPASSKILRTQKISGHNVRGLGLMPNGKSILVAHQTLNPMAETTHEGVFWGTVMSNNLRLISLQALEQENEKKLEETGIHFLGQPNQGAADPTSLLITPTDLVLTALGGVDELAVCENLDRGFDRIKVGRRPVYVVTDPECKLAYVANQFSDTISVVHLVGRQVVAEIPLLTADESRAPTLAEQGESLFYDASLSLDGWFSCHSCHTEGHTNGLLNSNLSDGTYKAPKRIPSLLGVGDTGPYLWNGQFDNLLDQIDKSVVTTMQGKPPTEHQSQALAAYLQSLENPPRLGAASSPHVDRGKVLFQEQACATCHVPPTFTSKGTFDVGLTDENGRTEFNPPSLRGVRYRGPFFHDLRAATLEDVFVKHHHPTARVLQPEELVDLIEYLNSL